MGPQADARAAVARLRAQFALPFTAAPSAVATAAASAAPAVEHSNASIGQEGAAAAETRRDVGIGADVEGWCCNEQGPRAGAAAGKADTQGWQPRPGAGGKACGAGIGSENPFSALMRDGRGARSDGGGNAENGVLRPCVVTGKYIYKYKSYLNVKHRVRHSMSGSSTRFSAVNSYIRQLFGVYVSAMAEARTKRETVKAVLALDPTAMRNPALCGVGQDTLAENDAYAVSHWLAWWPGPPTVEDTLGEYLPLPLSEQYPRPSKRARNGNAAAPGPDADSPSRKPGSYGSAAEAVGASGANTGAAGAKSGARADRRVADALHAAGLEGSSSGGSEDNNEDEDKDEEGAEASFPKSSLPAKVQGDVGTRQEEEFCEHAHSQSGGSDCQEPAGTRQGHQHGPSQSGGGKRRAKAEKPAPAHSFPDAGSKACGPGAPESGEPFDYAAARAAAPGLDLAPGMVAAGGVGLGRGGRGRGRRGGREGSFGRGRAETGRGRGGRKGDQGIGFGLGDATGGDDSRKRRPVFNPYDIPDEGLLKAGKRSTTGNRSGNRSMTFR